MGTNNKYHTQEQKDIAKLIMKMQSMQGYYRTKYLELDIKMNNLKRKLIELLNE